MPRERSLLRIDGGWHNATTDIARSIVGGRCSALIHLERVRDYPGAEQASRVAQWGTLLEGTSIDPLSDVERAFVTARSFDDRAGTALVLDLAFDDIDRVSDALRRLGERGVHATREPQPVVRTTFYGEDYVVALFGRSLVALPEAQTDRLPELAGCRGLPLPSGEEAISLFAEEPAVTLDGTVNWPEDIVELRADVRLSRWGASLDFVARSTSAAQAPRDAEALELTMNDLLKLDLVVFQVPLHDRVTFEAHHDQIEMTARFSRAELEVLIALGNL